jgi:DNA polymerase V
MKISRPSRWGVLFNTPVILIVAGQTGHAKRAAEKLRRENREWVYLAAFMSTSRYRSGEHYANQQGITLPFPTSDTRDIECHALGLARSFDVMGTDTTQRELF